jgi:hypothetical protein
VGGRCGGIAQGRMRRWWEQRAGSAWGGGISVAGVGMRRRGMTQLWTPTLESYRVVEIVNQVAWLLDPY